MHAYTVTLADQSRTVAHDDDPNVVSDAIVAACAELRALYPERAKELRVTRDDGVQVPAPMPIGFALREPLFAIGTLVMRGCDD